MAKKLKQEPPPVPVPEAEQPYPVPDNWLWVYANDCFNIEYGKGLPTKSLTESGFPVFGANGQIGCYTEYMFAEPQALMSCRGAYSGTMNMSLPNSYVTNNSLVIQGKAEKISPKYIFYLFQSQDVRALVTGSAQPQVTVRAFNEYPVPISPFPEQQRIVARIDSLFAKLDAAHELAQAVVDGYELRKAAILHRAFSGELSEKWRKGRGITGLRNTASVSSICVSMKYGTAKKSKKSGSIVVLRMGNLQNGEIDWTNLAYSDDEEDNKKYLLSAGDVLFNRTNSPELVGKTSIYRGGIPAIYAGYLIKLDYNHSIITGEYLNYMLNTPEAKEYCHTVKTDGVNQSNINTKRIGAFIIPVPSLEEQAQIVTCLNTVLHGEMQTMQVAQTVIDTIDTMKKKILGLAFRGELGTNNPAEESAETALRNT